MKYNQSCKTTGSIFNGAFSLRLAVDYPLNGAVAALVIRDKVRHVRMISKLKGVPTVFLISTATYLFVSFDRESQL